MPPFALKAMIRAKAPRALASSSPTQPPPPPPLPGCYDFAGMTIERNEAGEVRAPGGSVLAGSALTLDRAVRNLVAWRIAGADEAIRMASDHPAHALRPALEAHGVDLADGELTWSDDLALTAIRLGDLAV